MKKNGFTLVELLAVIAIIAILSIMIIPNVVGIFTGSKESNFLSEARAVYKTATNQHVMDRAKGLGSYYQYNSGLADVPGENVLDVSERTGFGYYVLFNQNDEIVYFYVKDDTYNISLGTVDTSSSSHVDLTDITIDSVQEFTYSDEPLAR